MTSSVLVSLRVRASPERAFDVFTQEICAWWRPHPLFQITPHGDGVLSFEDRKLITRLANGQIFEIGKVTEWRRGEKLAFVWRPAMLAEELATRVEVSFDAIGDETRVSVRHFGWLEIPNDHVARHHLRDAETQARVADWWRLSLAAFKSEF